MFIHLATKVQRILPDLDPPCMYDSKNIGITRKMKVQSKSVLYPESLTNAYYYPCLPVHKYCRYIVLLPAALHYNKLICKPQKCQYVKIYQ